MNTHRTARARALTGAANALTLASYLGIVLVLLATLAPDGMPRFDGPMWGAVVLCMALLGVDRIAVLLHTTATRIDRSH